MSYIIKNNILIGETTEKLKTGLGVSFRRGGKSNYFLEKNNFTQLQIEIGKISNAKAWLWFASLRTQKAEIHGGFYTV